jgi:prepilin-type N-terminal cleavage/methylation domain-containing protein
MFSNDTSPGSSALAKPFGNLRAFSLIEMLCTLAILLILFVLMWGRGASGFQKQQKAACRKNLLTLYTALDLYAKENKDTYPVNAGATSSEGPLSLLIPRYTTTLAPFICPGTKDAPLPEGKNLESLTINYAYYMGWQNSASNAPLMSDPQVSTAPKHANDPIFSTDGKKPGNNHHKYGGNILFTSGEVETISPKAPFALDAPDTVKLLNPRK